MRNKAEIQREWAKNCAKLGQAYYRIEELKVAINNLTFELAQLAEEAKAVEEEDKAKADSQ